MGSTLTALTAAAAAALIGLGAHASGPAEMNSKSERESSRVGAPAPGRAEANSQREPESTPLRPRNPTKNLPSDSGSQTTTPSGAVTGAGHAHGTIRQPDVGAPGGLEPRARAADRATTSADERRTPANGSSEFSDQTPPQKARSEPK